VRVRPVCVVLHRHDKGLEKGLEGCPTSQLHACPAGPRGPAQTRYKGQVGDACANQLTVRCSVAATAAVDMLAAGRRHAGTTAASGASAGCQASMRGEGQWPPRRRVVQQGPCYLLVDAMQHGSQLLQGRTCRMLPSV
jgi:hypothetical protein